MYAPFPLFRINISYISIAVTYLPVVKRSFLRIKCRQHCHNCPTVHYHTCTFTVFRDQSADHILCSLYTALLKICPVFSTRKCTCATGIKPSLIYWLVLQFFICLSLIFAKIQFSHQRFYLKRHTRPDPFCCLPASEHRADGQCINLRIVFQILRNHLLIQWFIRTSYILFLTVAWRHKMPYPHNLHLLPPNAGH